MKVKNRIKLLSLSTFSRLEEMYPEWVEKHSCIAVLSTRLSCGQLLKKVANHASRIFIIDCVSEEKHEQSVCVPGLNSLTAMALAIAPLIKMKKVELLVIDSLSSLIIHNDVVSVLKFANDISQKARTAGCNLTYPVLETDRVGKLAAVELYVDKVEKL